MTGAFEARKKDGTVYYRASLTYRRKHISLGSYGTEKEAAKAYTEGQSILHENNVTLENFLSRREALDPEKAVLLLNLRDNHTYFKTPIYLRQGYFSYFVDGTRELKFSNDDLFYYSEHRILLHDGHYYVNDYGMQYGILERFGIRPWWVILALALVSGALGVLLLLRPWRSAQVLTALLGVGLLATGALNFAVAVSTVKIVKNQYPDVIESEAYAWKDEVL